MDLTPLRLLEQSRFVDAVAHIHSQLAGGTTRDEALQLLALLANIHLSTRDFAAAVPVLVTLVNQGGPATGQHLLTLARAQLDAGDHAQALVALELLQGAAALPAVMADLSLLRARALHGLARDDDARAALDATIQHVPGHAEAMLWRALLAPPRPGAPRLISALTDPAQWQQLHDATQWDWPAAWIPSDFVARLAPFLYPERFRDTRFIVVDNQGRPLLRGDAFANGAGIGAAVTGPVRLVPAAGCDRWHDAIKPAIDHILALAAAFGGTALITELPPTAPGRLSPVGTACLKRGGTAETQVVMDMDLTRPEAELWSNLRKSYRPLITAGDKRFHLRVMNRDNPDWSLFECYRVLHYIHFPGSGAELMFAARSAFNTLLECGQMELLVGFDGERPISATMIVDEAGTAQYYSARYVRDAGLDVGPWALWSAVRRSRERGLPRFHLGYHDFHECGNDKMRNIAFFKAGFAETLRYDQFWRLDQPGLTKDQ